MPSALLHALLCVVFLAVYVLAGEVLVGVQRRRRARLLRPDGPEAHELHWHYREGGGRAVASHG